jgi:two-component system LytT family response regulator
MPAPRLTAIIVDDEAPARLELQRMLTAHPEVHVVGEADGVEPAERLIVSTRPDVLFLDIALGGLTGFDLLARVDVVPEIVFVTAYEEHALRAFDVNALSYLLKPVQRARLAEVVGRLLARTSTSPVASAAPLEPDDYLFLEVRGRQTFVQVRDIRCLTAEGNYSRLTLTSGQSGLCRVPLAHWLPRLPRRRFAQIHRSAIVNIREIERIESHSASTQLVFLRQMPTPLTMSRRYAARLQQQFA